MEVCAVQLADGGELGWPSDDCGEAGAGARARPRLLAASPACPGLALLHCPVHLRLIFDHVLRKINKLVHLNLVAELY